MLLKFYLLIFNFIFAQMRRKLRINLYEHEKLYELYGANITLFVLQLLFSSELIVFIYLLSKFSTKSSIGDVK